MQYWKEYPDKQIAISVSRRSYFSSFWFLLIFQGDEQASFLASGLVICLAWRSNLR